MTNNEERLYNNLESAITILRKFCDQAEQRIEQGKERGNLAEQVGEVIHSFGWGLANASTAIQSALYALQDQIKK